MRKGLAPLLLAIVGLCVAGCAAAEEPEPVAKTFEFGTVFDNTDTGWYSVTGAHGVSDQFGSRLTLDFAISNSNNTIFSPVSTIEYADGTVVVCQADDLRRLPSLVDSTTDWEFACDGPFADDANGATVTVVDSYNMPQQED